MKHSKVEGLEIFYENSAEFRVLTKEIFTRHCYWVELETYSPRILDIGAHIGLATLYYKKLYPHAQVTMVEPNPLVWPILEKNIWENMLESVVVEKVAVSDHVGRQNLYLDRTEDEWWSTAGFVEDAWNGSQKTKVIEVETKKLSDFLTRRVDVVKMDIEGAEEKVLAASEEMLVQVGHWFIEYHPVEGNSLERILEILERARFEWKLYKNGMEMDIKGAKGLVMIEAWAR
jgi:FkbM family methyltransferase